MNKILALLFGVFLVNCSFAQDDLVRIKLEKGKTDILKINNQFISEAYVYGNRENLIKFLINDKYLDHYHHTATVYNFSLADIKSFNNAELNSVKSESNKVLIVTQSRKDFEDIYNKLKTKEIISGKTENVFKLAEINNLNVYVSYELIDTIIFNDNENATFITLNEKISDAFHIEGTSIPIVKIYGTKENIIRFLINDKYIKHRLYGEGANYSFIKIPDTTFFSSYFDNESGESSKILIAIKNHDEFINLYNELNDEKITTVDVNSSLVLEAVNNLEITVYPSFD
jgi:hypothetical protein